MYRTGEFHIPDSSNCKYEKLGVDEGSYITPFFGVNEPKKDALSSTISPQIKELKKGIKSSILPLPTRSSLRYFCFIANLRQAKALHRMF